MSKLFKITRSIRCSKCHNLRQNFSIQSERKPKVFKVAKLSKVSNYNFSEIDLKKKYYIWLDCFTLFCIARGSVLYAESLLQAAYVLTGLLLPV